VKKQHEVNVGKQMFPTLYFFSLVIYLSVFNLENHQITLLYQSQDPNACSNI
jgi:hypothetical protein